MRGSHAPTRGVSGAVLAGGLARRFSGRDKSTLIVEGQTILTRQLSVLRPLVDTLMIIGTTAEPLADVIVMPDIVDRCGPMGGLLTALTAATTPTVLVLACDMPFVTEGLLAHLIDACGPHDAAVPRVDGRWHPLCACYRTHIVDEVRMRIEAGTFRLSSLIDAIDTHPVEVDTLSTWGDPAHLLSNINSADDYQRLLP